MVGVPYPTVAETKRPPAIRANPGAIPRVVVAPAIAAFFSKFKPFVSSASTIAPAFETPSHFAPPV
jgi:hypothetical protein